MKPLKPVSLPAFDWYAVIAAFAEHAGMSFNTMGCWNLDFPKLPAHPIFPVI